MNGKLTIRDLRALLALAVLLVLFFSPVLLPEPTLYSRDISHYYRPAYQLAATSLQRGTFPFWNPFISCGQPFLAALQNGMLYPVSLITFLFPFEAAFKIVFLIPFFLAGLGLYLLLRGFRLPPLACLAASVLYCFGGVMSSLVNLLTTLAASAWLSFVCLFFIKALEQKDKWWGWALLTACCLSLEFFAGQPEILYLSILVLLIYGLLASPGRYAATFKILGTTVILVVLFILFELLPFWQLLKHSNREAYSTWESQTFWSLYPGQLKSLFSSWFSQPAAADNQEWLKNIFFGGSGVFLAGCGLLSGKTKKTWLAILAVAVLGLLLSFGKYTFAYRALSWVLPGLKAIRYPVKFFFLFNWGLALLAAAGWHHWFQYQEQYKKSGILLLAAGMFMLAGYGFLSWPVIFLDLGIFSLFLGGMALCRLPSRWQGYGQAGLIAILFCGSAVHTFNTQKLALLSFVEHRGDFKQQLDTLSYNRYAFTPKTYAVLTGNAQDTRDYQVEYTVLDQSLWESVPNMAMVGHEFVARGYESIYLNNFYSFYWLTSFQPGPASSHILDLLGVKYLVSLWPVSSPGFDLVKQNVWQIYKNNNAFPRVFLVNKEVVTADLAGTMHRMQEHISYGTTARIIHYDLNRVTIEAESGPDSTLVLTDTFYSGWRASVDGGPARIFPAFYMFRGIDLPAGKHEIIFTYRPDYFYPALLVTLLAILTSIGYFLRELKAWSQDK